MKLSVKAGTTSETIELFIQDSSQTDGRGLTGLVFNTSSLAAYYSFPRAAATSITLATLSTVTAAWSSGGFKEIDSTNKPGCYRFDVPNAVIASGNGRYVNVMLRGATNMAPVVLEIELTGWDNQDGIHGGMTALPNTAVTTNASLLTSGTGTDQLSVSGGNANSDCKKINAVATTSVTAVNANVGTTQPTNFTGTAGSALVKSDAVDIAGSAVSTTSAQLGVNVVNYGGQAVQLANNLPLVNVVRASTGQAGGNANAMKLDAGASSTNDLYKGQLLFLTGGTGAGQVRTVTNYNGGTKIATVDRSFATNPDNTTTFALLATDGPTLNSNLQVTANVSQAIIRSGTAQAGSANTITLDAGASATNNIYNGDLVTITGGTGLGQSRTVISYNGTTKVATVAGNWNTNPDVTSTFNLLASTTASNFSDQGVAQAGGASTITLASTASATDSLYVGSLVTILSGTGLGQTRQITAYNGTTKVATVDTAWSTPPSSDSAYAVIPAAGSDASQQSAQQFPANFASLTISSNGNVVADSVLGDVLGKVLGGGSSTITGVGAYADIQTIKTQTVTCAAGVTVNTNVGTTQQVNFTGTGGSALVKTDVTDWNASAAGALPANFSSFSIDLSGRIDLGKILGTANAGVAGYVGVDWSHVNAPTTAVNLSGTTISTSQQVALTASGLDGVLIESSISAGASLTNETGTQLTAINARQALSLSVSALAAVLAGAGTTSITIKPTAKGASSVNRIAATVDANGNRTALTLKVPD